MQVYNLPERLMTEKVTSNNFPPLSVQRGLISSKLNGSATFIPCDLQGPVHLSLTALLHTDDANGVAMGTTTVVPEVDSYDSLKAISDIDAWAQNVAYKVGTLISNPAADKAYICLVAHTSTTGGTAAADWATDLAAGYWLELSTTTFLKVTHTAAGSGKILHASYLIFGR